MLSFNDEIIFVFLLEEQLLLLVQILGHVCFIHFQWPFSHTARRNGPNDDKTFFMLNSVEHEFYPANKSQITKPCKFFLAKYS